MSIFCNDTFTDTSATLLENHTGETGATWTKNPSFGTGSAAISSAGRARGNATNGVYYSSGVPSSADYDVEADLIVQSNVNSAGIIAREGTAAATYYLFDYESNGAWHLYTVVNGATQNSTSFSQTLTVGQTYRMRLSVRGNTITCFVNGVQVMKITDGNVASAGRAGLFFGAADTDSTGYHLDNFSGAVPLTVAVTDGNVFFSPYNWYSDGSAPMLAGNVNTGSTLAQSNTPGAYLKFNIATVSAGNVALLLDASPLNGITAANCPELAISVDGQAFTTSLLAYATGTTRLQLAGDLSAGTHTFLVYFRSVTLNSSNAMGDRWNTPASLVKVTGVELDGRGSATAAQTPRSKRLIAWGDSITEGADAVGSGNNNADQDATQSWAQVLAVALDAEVGIIGFSGQGWTVAGYGNVPRFHDTTTPSNSTFDKYYSGTSRLGSGALTPAPDYAIVLHGKNDASQGATDASVTATVSAWLPALRAEAPQTRIFVAVPFDGSKRSAITSGVSAISDSRVSLMDLGSAIQSTLSSGGLNTNDAIHPNVRGHATFASMLLKQIEPLINTGGSASSFAASTGNFIGGSVSLTDGAFAT